MKARWLAVLAGVTVGAISAALIAVLGTLRWGRKVPGVLPMSLDGLRRGEQAEFLAAFRWEEHWESKLDDLRSQLRIAPPSARPVSIAAK